GRQLLLQPADLRLQPPPLGVELLPAGVDRLGELHDLRRLALELADPPADRRDVVLQRLQLAGVGDRAGVQLLLRLGGALGQRGHLVLESLLAAGELVPALVDLGDLGLDLGEGGPHVGELGALRQSLALDGQLVEAGVPGLDREQRLPATHRRRTLSSDGWPPDITWPRSGRRGAGRCRRARSPRPTGAGSSWAAPAPRRPRGHRPPGHHRRRGPGRPRPPAAGAWRAGAVPAARRPAVPAV